MNANPLSRPDPRGPLRTIVSAQHEPHAAIVTLSCGHVREFNQIYSYKVGEEARCFDCAREESR